MNRPELLTIDMTVARDFLDPKRSGHLEAKELFALNGNEVRLAIGPQGQRLDAPDGDLRVQLEEMCERQNVTVLRQLAYLSEATFPSEDLLLGQLVDGFKDAWRQVIKTWKTSDGKPPEHPDDFHMEAHLLEDRDVFLTADRALRAMCRRLSDEHGFPVAAMTVGAYLEGRCAPG